MWSALAPMALSALSSAFGRKSSTWSGTQPSFEKKTTLTHEQRHALKKLFSKRGMQTTEQNPLYQQGSSYLSRILSQDPEVMKQFEAPEIRQFQERIAPQIAERFADMGALSSGAFDQTMAQEAGSLAERLAAMRANLGMEAQNAALGYAQIPFSEQMQRMNLGMRTPAFGYLEHPGTAGMGTGLQSELMKYGSSQLGPAVGGLWDSIKGMFGGGGRGKSSSVLYPSESIF